MKNNIVTNIKFIIKEGCVDDFLAAQAKMEGDPLLAPLSTFTI